MIFLKKMSLNFFPVLCMKTQKNHMVNAAIISQIIEQKNGELWVA